MLLLAFVFGCVYAVEVGGEDEVGGGGCPLFFPGVGLGLDVLVEVGWDSEGDAFGGGVFVGDFSVGCGVGCEAFGEEAVGVFLIVGRCCGGRCVGSIGSGLWRGGGCGVPVVGGGFLVFAVLF